MNYLLKGLMLLMLFFVIGETVSYYFNIPIPGNVIGMLLIFVGLYMGIVKENEIENIAKQLIKLLNLFFIPAGVGLLAHEKLIQENLLIIITASIISSLVVMFVAAKVFLMMKK